MAIEKTKEGRTYMGAALRAARKAENLSLEEVGSRVGVIRQTISKIETGKWNPGAEHLVAIADALGYEWNLTKRETEK